MATDIKDLWIGDLVVLSASGREGKFAGISLDGRARIDVLGKIILVKANQISLKPITDAFPDHLLTDLLEDRSVSTKSNNIFKVKVGHSIDLHIDKLAPEMTNDFPGKIIEFQLLTCKKFIDEALRLRHPVITIIHGKGQGVLKKEVEALIQSYTSARFKISKNDGGAIEVWFDG
jgi:hypothetical protein